MDRSPGMWYGSSLDVKKAGRELGYWMAVVGAVAWGLALAGRADDGGFVPPAGYGSGGLWLEVTGVRDGVAWLRLHGTQAGGKYQILASERPADPAWTSVGAIAGAAGQDWTPATVALGPGLNAAFFRARIQSLENGLRLELPADGLAVRGQMAVVVRNTLPGVQYDVLTSPAMPTPTWTMAGSMFGAAGNSTPLTLPLNSRANLFVWIRVGDGSADSASGTTDSMNLTADRVTAFFAGGAGAPLTADTTRASADIQR
jgi:hypothetical protein